MDQSCGTWRTYTSDSLKCRREPILKKCRCEALMWQNNSVFGTQEQDCDV